jgi:hypothetical protein
MEVGEADRTLARTLAWHHTFPIESSGENMMQKWHVVIVTMATAELLP